LRGNAIAIEKQYISKVKTGKMPDDFLKLLRQYVSNYNQIKIHTNQIELLENVIAGDRTEIEQSKMTPITKIIRRPKEKDTNPKSTNILIKKEIIFKPENEFVRKGDGWLIKYKNSDHFILPHLKGLTYIAYLILNEKKNIHGEVMLKLELNREKALEVMDLETEKLERYTRTIEEGEQWVVKVDEGYVKPTDTKAAEKYQRRARKIRRDLEENVHNAKEKGVLEQELEQLQKLIYMEYKNFQIPSENDDNRKKNISKAIKDVIDGFIMKYDKALAKHLESSITRKWIYFVYEPIEEISWVVDPFEKKKGKNT
jgi:hypothetical protein